MILVQKTFKSRISTDIEIDKLTVESDLSAVNPEDCSKFQLAYSVEGETCLFKTSFCKASKLKNGSGVKFKDYYWNGTEWVSRKELDSYAIEHFTKIINLQKSMA